MNLRRVRFHFLRLRRLPQLRTPGSQGISSGLLQGLGHASGWFDDSVNVGAPSSGASALTPRVSFSIPPSVGEEEMDTTSVMGDASQPSDALRRLCRLLAQLCPEAFVGSTPAAPKTCQFEGLFSEVTRLPPWLPSVRLGKERLFSLIFLPI